MTALPIIQLKLFVISLNSRLKFFILKKNSGAAAARNYGVKMAQGEYISFLDSDDYYDPNFLEESSKLFSKAPAQVGFMWTGVRYHYKKKTIDTSWAPLRKETAYLSFLHNLQIGSGSGITLKKKAFTECGGFNENLPAAEDTDFFLRITQKYDYTYSKKILMNVVKKGEDRMSISFDKIAKAYNIFLPAHYPTIDKYQSLQYKFYYKMMWLNYHLRDKEKARKYYSKIPGFLSKGKSKALVVRILYEVFPLNLASVYHQKISSS